MDETQKGTGTEGQQKPHTIKGPQKKEQEQQGFQHEQQPPDRRISEGTPPFQGRGNN